MREEILGGKSAPVEVKKKTEPTKLEVVEEIQTETPKIQEVVEISWEGFIKDLYKNNKPIAVNLERGNLLNKDSLGKENTTLNIAFAEECRIFFDFLNEYETSQSLINSLASYLQTDSSNISINLHMIDDQARADKNFKSSVEIEENIIMEKRDEKRKEIETNRFIKEAEELFNTKVEKIILNEE